MNDQSFLRPSVAIIGGGFAGAMLVLRLVRDAPGPLSLTVIEPRETVGRGVAYSTPDPVHLVNGPSSMFSAHEDDPDHFTRWTLAEAGRTGWQPPEDPGDGFAPRAVYGRYVEETLERAVAEAEGRVQVRHLRGTADTIRLETRRPGRRQVVIATEAGSVRADVAVLATGVFPLPPPSVAVLDHETFVAGPGDQTRLSRVAPLTGEILLIGTSLSMVDAVASLEARGFRGRYRAISRHGYLIEGRRDRGEPADFLAETSLPRTTRDLLARVIAARRRLLQAGGDWQELVPAIRPHVPALWAEASDAERRRFIRHLRSLWDVTLHVAAPETYRAVHAARAQGRFVAEAARLLDLRRDGDGLAATVRRRGTRRQETHLFEAVIDCRGYQQHDWRQVEAPLVRQLVGEGLVRPHPTGFGVEATAHGAVIGRDGKVDGRLWAIGHPLRGAAWESSSIPEQRAQAAALAPRLLELVSRAAAVQVAG